MSRFSIPTRDEVSEGNRAIFDDLRKKLGMVPNLYAYYAKSETALADYLAFQGRKTTLNAKEREVVNLVTSQINGCRYCQSAHTAVGKMTGFSDEEIIQLRGGTAPFDTKLDALARFVAEAVRRRGHVSEEIKEVFFDAGYTEENLIDVIINVGDKVISNFIHNVAEFTIDFPVAPELETVTA